MPDLNRRLSGLESAALPTELISHGFEGISTLFLNLLIGNQMDSALHSSLSLIQTLQSKVEKLPRCHALFVQGDNHD